ncbi:MAG: VOC family protein [Deltaproteobacteria bacterium]|nr:VOC family protein [Deltaproteobacteria bacterium]
MGNPIRHWEFMVNNPEKVKEFYRKVFSWRFDSETYPNYTNVITGEKPEGGLMKNTTKGAPSSLNVYFEVDAVEPVLRNVIEAGGKVIVPRTEIPNIGWFAFFEDPESIPVGILELKKTG